MKKMNIPTYLTWLRIIFIIPLVMLILLGWHIEALVLYALIAATDFLDGFLARRWNAESRFGAFLDPIADKLLVIAVLFAFVATGHLRGLAVFLPILITAREIWVSGLRGLIPSGDLALPVSKLAKWKTASQMIAIALLFLIKPVAAIYASPVLLICTLILLLLSTLLTLWTGLTYTKAAQAFMVDEK